MYGKERNEKEGSVGGRMQGRVGGRKYIGKKE